MAHSCPNQVLKTMPSKRPSAQGPSLRSARRVGSSSQLSIIVAALLLVLAAASQALAWGRVAHRASAKLAESRLSPRTRALIRELLEPGESGVGFWTAEPGVSQ